MSRYEFIDSHGTFRMDNPQHTSGLYIPVAGNTGLRSAVTPDFGGDSKLDQNHFLIAPKSISNLHSDRDTRNFFCVFKDDIWSATGASATQEADRFTDREDEVQLVGGRMWQTVTRTSKKWKITSEVTIFSLLDTQAEIMIVKLTNDSGADLTFTPVAAVPIYARSADNLRDHRHVTSLLNRAVVSENGVIVKPTLSFDERGHQINDTSYYVIGADENGKAPAEFIADTDLYLGEGGTFLRPRSILSNDEGNSAWKKAPFNVDGKENIGALKFDEVKLEAGKSVTFQIAAGCFADASEKRGDEQITKALEVISSADTAQKAFFETAGYWNSLTNIHVKTGDHNFDCFMEWIAFQPQLRRIYGCSFLPHHDYGRGGRGWRDLWQDCLALLLTDPKGVREMILDNFKGVRLDGTNATIIGDHPGEFKADRNGIPRVWMDHGFWPFLTLRLYMDQTGDLDILSEDVSYFKDAQIMRAKDRDDRYSEEQGVIQKTEDGRDYLGSVLEHVLIQNLTAVYDVGENGEIRLRGADWNDALDMARDKGESVAFTCGYAGNLQSIAEYLRIYSDRSGNKDCLLIPEIKELLTGSEERVFADTKSKNDTLKSYMRSVSHEAPAERESFSISEIADALDKKADLMMKLIREKEWVTDSEGNGWYNGYYDNEGRRVEGEFDTGDGKNVRMMLTGAVFSIMSGTAEDDRIPAITKSADKYLYSRELGGYRLNTDFKALRTDLGRMFGFSYGDKENGAVFSHMAVMYGNALYRRGFAKEGFVALNSLYDAAMNFEVSRIYPGIPEYFNGEGRGLYNYLTGAASWYLMTVVTEEFGVRGMAGDLVIDPKLLACQFDASGEASITLPFRDRIFNVVFHNEAGKSYSEYSVEKVLIDGKEEGAAKDGLKVISSSAIDALSAGVHKISVYL
ncbi:MAG: cellobiose phosphorylase [Butyrivibrio sp.]|nr:cellobiose phosphorylase [Butyrivibrio sp.]